MYVSKIKTTTTTTTELVLFLLFFITCQVIFLVCNLQKYPLCRSEDDLIFICCSFWVMVVRTTF